MKLSHIALAALSLLLWLSDPAFSAFKREALAIESGSARRSYEVEMALTPEEQQAGLMHRAALPDGQGMLFIFPGEARPRMWMKDTLIPLDMIFIDKHGIIQHIKENALPHDTSIVSIPAPSRGVLELPGGEASRQGIKPGDRVIHPAFVAP